MSGSRSGSVLATVVVLMVIIGVLGLALMNRTLGSHTRAEWGKDHLVLRLLAESAADDLYAQVSHDVNERNSPIFVKFRTIFPDDGSDPQLPIMLDNIYKPDQARSSPSPGVMALGQPELTYHIMIHKADEVSDDGTEARGVLRITVDAVAGGRFLGISEHVSVDHGFRIARETLHPPLDEDALIVKRLWHGKKGGDKGGDKAGDGDGGGNGGGNGDGDAEGDGDGDGGGGPGGGGGGPGGGGGGPGGGGGGPGGGGGGGGGKGKKPHSWFNPHVPCTRTMKEIVGEKGSAMRQSPAEWVAEVGPALQMYNPWAAEERAQFTAWMPMQLRWFLIGRLKREEPIHGVYFCGGKRPLFLEIPRFTGHAVIIARGPIVLGDIKMIDPAKDSLTIASGRRIIVVGSDVQANLVSFGGRRKGVEFVEKTHITGTVISQRIPRARKGSKEDFEASQISGVPGADYSQNENAAPPTTSIDLDELAHYRTMFSPTPTRVSHVAE